MSTKNVEVAEEQRKRIENDLVKASEEKSFLEKSWREKEAQLIKAAKKRDDELRRVTKAHDKLKTEVDDLKGDSHRQKTGPKFMPQIAASPLLARVANAVEMQMRARIQSLVLVGQPKTFSQHGIESTASSRRSSQASTQSASTTASTATGSSIASGAGAM